MKKFAPRVAIVALLLSLFTAVFAVPASATGPSVNQTSGTGFYGWTGQALTNHPTYSVSGFSGAPTFTVSPALPNGVSINASTGEVTGTPTVGIDETTFTVTATYNTEVATAIFDLTVVQNISVTSSVASVSPSVANSSAIVLTFGHSAIVNSATGSISVVLQNATPTTPGSCAGVTLSPAATSCALNLNGSTYSYQFDGVDLTNVNSTFTMTFAAGTLTAGSSGYLGLNVNISNGVNSPSLNAGSPGISIGSGNQQQNQSATFTTSNYSFQRASGPSFSTLAVGANVPAFTMTFGGFSGGIAVNQINYLLGDPYNDVFFTVPGSVSNNSQNYATWDPASSTCGITAVRFGGVSQTANSGVTCVKSTYAASGAATQYWIAVKFATPTTAEISIDTAAGVFVVSQAGNLNYFATLFNNGGSTTYRSNASQAFDGAGQSAPSVASSPVSFAIPVAPGQRIVGEDVAITATDLALSTDYSVVLRSTPQILASGRTVSSSFNTSVTIPANLEAGWHSITFNATRSDGAAVSEVVYFKITADGTLLATSTDTPAELALTGMVTGGAIPLSIIALLMGLAAFFVAREINPDFMRVMTLTRNEKGELDFVKRRIRSADF